MLTFSRRTTPAHQRPGRAGRRLNNNLTLDLGLQPGAGDRRRPQPDRAHQRQRQQQPAGVRRPSRAGATDCTVYSSSVDLGFNHPLLRGLRVGHRPGQHPPPAGAEGSGAAQPADAGRQRAPRRDQHLLGPVLRHPGPGHPPLGGRSGPRAAAGDPGPDRRRPPGPGRRGGGRAGHRRAPCRRCWSPSRTCCSARWSCAACSGCRPSPTCRSTPPATSPRPARATSTCGRRSAGRWRATPSCAR